MLIWIRKISKNLAEIKSIKVSNKNPDRLVLGADSVVSLDNELINKPKSREEAFSILKKLNNSIHYLISSVCISKNGAMIWNHTDSSELKMKNLDDFSLSKYLDKIKTETLLAYGVYQIEADGLELFEYVKGDKDSIMGLPIKEIIDYIKWGQEVVNNLPYKDMKLMKRFDKICFQLNKKLSSN